MTAARPIFLFTDFGCAGPYVGQLHAAILGIAPQSPVIDLMHDAPSMRPDLAAYLLAACSRFLPHRAVVVAVVDPGVGGARDALVVDTGRATFVGPDNGLLSRLDGITGVRRIDWRPPDMSTSFHGRDLFAPVAARLAAGATLEMTPVAQADFVGHAWPDEVDQVVYIDGYGNLMLGRRAATLRAGASIELPGISIPYAETFSKAPKNQLFWYGNSQGLAEIAANGASAAAILSLALGDSILLD